jgi:hypothetical protein
MTARGSEGIHVTDAFEKAVDAASETIAAAIEKMLADIPEPPETERAFDELSEQLISGYNLLSRHAPMQLCCTIAAKIEQRDELTVVS